ncbi:MAG: DUF1272 domain-containing protein [Bacteroidota bacterium]
MLDMRPVCENCTKPLPNETTEAMICTFECTFCSDCVTKILENVCPNCGGGFEKRPTRPNTCATENCITNFPVATEQRIRPVNSEHLSRLKLIFKNTDPRKR